MNCLAHIIKYILFLTNLLTLICGILLIVFGALAITNLKDFLTFTEADSTKTLPICILILGGVICIVSFFGCCGAIKDSHCLVFSYCICMFLLFILQIALIVYAWFYKETLLKNMATIVDKAWENHTDEPTFMDALQLSFKCCGYELGSQDYLNSGETIPNSCCGLKNGACEPAQVQALPGCRQSFVDFWGYSTNLIKYAGMGVAAVELAALVLGWFLVASIKVSRKDINARTY